MYFTSNHQSSVRSRSVKKHRFFLRVFGEICSPAQFLAPTGAQGEAMSCVRDIIQKNIENEF